MKREILFRGKPVDPNCEWKWIEGYLVIDKLNVHNIYHPLDTTIGGFRVIEVIPESVGEFTGLRDTNGVKVFEGDILDIKEFWNEGNFMDYEEIELFELDDLKGKLHDEYTTDVMYEPGCFVIKTKPDDYDCFASVLEGNQKHSQPIFDSKIIGNIHDNPELLKK